MKHLGKTIILIVLFISILQSVLLVSKTYSEVNAYKKHLTFPGTGKAAGVVSLCINAQPILNLSNCNPSINQSLSYTPYTCWVNASNPDHKNLAYSSVFLLVQRAFNNSNNSLFSIRSDGFINFTPTNNEVGNYTIQFTVNDGRNCSNSEDSAYFDLSVNNTNDPPYLIQSIPNQSISEGEILHAFYLNSYFADPDLDPLTYSVITTSSEFTININNVTSEVVISSSTCDVNTKAIFVAKDPYNATASSNLVTIRCILETPSPKPGGGSGAGGGGGAGITELCKSEYECFDYYRCNRSNVKVQRCVDTKGCKKDVYLTVPCNYEETFGCNESWKCSDWVPCLPNGTQDRTCYDSNSCGTTKGKPLLIRECEYIGTCQDGIKNCHDNSCEEGIDCGGPCVTCKSIEVPYPFEEEKGILIYIITGIILLLLTAILLYHYFRKEINATLAKAGWIITKRRKKQILLSPEDKKKLLAGISELEEKLDKRELFDTLNKYSELVRYYLIKACGDGLSPEFDLDELKAVLNKKKVRIREILRKIFVSSFAKYLEVEQNKVLITKRNIILLLEELRNLVLQTSKVEPEDVAREVKELVIPDKGTLEKMVVMIINSYIALEFLELDIAKKKYLEILAEYEKFNVKEQEAIFEDISRLYHNISYVNSWLEKPIV